MTPLAPRPSPLATIFIVDDDPSARDGLLVLVRSAGWHGEAFASAHDFLARPPFAGTGSVVLDVSMPGMTGLDLQKELKRRRLALPVIAISARDDVETSRLARQLGARVLFRKPVDDQALLDAIHWVLEGDRPKPASG